MLRKHHFAPKPLDTISEQFHQHQRASGLSITDALANGSINPIDITNPVFRRSSESSGSMNDDDDQFQHHVPHALCELLGPNNARKLELIFHRSTSKPKTQRSYFETNEFCSSPTTFQSHS
jgi:hypothetical protein